MASELANDPSTARAPLRPLGVTVRPQGPAVVLLVEGEVDMASAPTLVECFDRVMTDPVDLVIVDLAGVTFLDSSGIASLVRAQRQFQGAGRDFCVRNPTPMVQRVLRITGVDDLLM